MLSKKLQLLYTVVHNTIMCLMAKPLNRSKDKNLCAFHMLITHIEAWLRFTELKNVVLVVVFTQTRRSSTESQMELECRISGFC